MKITMCDPDNQVVIVDKEFWEQTSKLALSSEKDIEKLAQQKFEDYGLHRGVDFTIRIADTNAILKGDSPIVRVGENSYRTLADNVVESIVNESSALIAMKIQGMVDGAKNRFSSYHSYLKKRNKQLSTMVSVLSCCVIGLCILLAGLIIL